MNLSMESRMKAGMKSIRSGLLLFGAVLFVITLTPLCAEVVKLNDGTVVEVALIAEDDQQVTLEIKMAGGTITSKRTYKKSEIVEIVRPTTEQKAQVEMQAAYETARKYQLDPNASFPLAQYDKVINEVFTP